MNDAPSTQWKEQIADDEGERYAAAAAQFAEIQERKSKRYGSGRTLHRKQLTAAHASHQRPNPAACSTASALWACFSSAARAGGSEASGAGRK